MILRLYVQFKPINSEAGISNFKLGIVFWNNFWGDWEIWKTNLTFWKKASLKRALRIGYATWNSNLNSTFFFKLSIQTDNSEFHATITQCHRVYTAYISSECKCKKIESVSATQWTQICLDIVWTELSPLIKTGTFTYRDSSIT